MPNPRPTYTNLEFDQQFGSKVSKRVPDVQNEVVETPENLTLSTSELRRAFSSQRTAVTVGSGSFTQNGLYTNSKRIGVFSPTLGLYAFPLGSSSDNAIITSPDGITWTKRATSGGTFGFFGIVWASGLNSFYVPLVQGSTFRIFRSFDGITWTSVYTRTSVPGGAFHSIAYSPNVNAVLVSVSVDSNLPHVRITATTTTEVGNAALKYGTVYFSSVLNKFVCTKDNDVYTSAEGLVWEKVLTATNSFADFFELPEISVVFARSSTLLYRSEDGVNWELVYTRSGGTGFKGAPVHNPNTNELVFAISDSLSEVKKSNDFGKTWTVGYSGIASVESIYWSASYNNYLFFAGAQIGFSFNGNTVAIIGTKTSGQLFYLSEIDRFINFTAGPTYFLTPAESALVPIIAREVAAAVPAPLLRRSIAQLYATWTEVTPGNWEIDDSDVAFMGDHGLLALDVSYPDKGTIRIQKTTKLTGTVFLMPQQLNNAALDDGGLSLKITANVASTYIDIIASDAAGLSESIPAYIYVDIITGTPAS